VAAETDANYILFCGVHFMAESADILAHEGQQVILPDLNAGCSMADMAEIGQVEECWETLLNAGMSENEILPVTYMNSSAAIKAFCGERGRTGLYFVECAQGVRVGVCAREEDSLSARSAPGPQHRSCDGHSADGNGGLRPVADWRRHYAGAAARDEGRLWKGHCSVHQRFLPEHVDKVRAKYPGIQVIVHPECRIEVCEKAMRWARRKG